MRKHRPHKDLTGMRFNKLTVLSSDEYDKYNSMVWNCQCDCGNFHKVVGHHLTRNRIKSCGCLGKELQHQRMLESMNKMIGKKFHKLKLIEFLGIENRRNIFRCQCDCGEEKITSYQCLINDYVKSCGCSNPTIFKDKTGEKYGKLTVIKLDHKNEKGNYWECLCECGKTVIIETSSLRKRDSKKSTKSCGCIISEILLNYHTENYKNLSGQKFNRLTAQQRVRQNKKWVWECLCDCGETTYLNQSVLMSGRTKSCGCLTSEVNSSKKREKSVRWRKDLTREERELSKKEDCYPKRTNGGKKFTNVIILLVK